MCNVCIVFIRNVCQADVDIDKSLVFAARVIDVYPVDSFAEPSEGEPDNNNGDRLVLYLIYCGC